MEDPGSSSPLTHQEWRNVIDAIVINKLVLVSTISEAVVLDHAVLRTLRYRKLFDLFRADWLVSGQCKLEMLPTGLRRQTIWKARKALEKRGVLVFKRRGKSPQSALYVYFNLPGVSKVMAARFQAMAEIDRRALKVSRFWDHISEYSMEMWKALKLGPVEVEPMGGSNDLVSKKDHEKSYTARAKSQSRWIWSEEIVAFLKRETNLSSSWVSLTMKNICDELGQRYSEGLPTEKEEKMIRRSARNFLTYCQNAGKNPREILYSVVENWKKFNRNVIKQDNGSYAIFSDIVEFMTFFRYRDQILLFLQEKAMEDERAAACSRENEGWPMPEPYKIPLTGGRDIRRCY